MNTREAERIELPEVTGYGTIICDSRYAYLLYYPEIEETPKSYAESVEMEREQITAYARGFRYDMETGESLESDVLDKLAKKVLLLDLDRGDSMFCEVAAVQGGSGEAYYVLNNKGLIRIDDRGEELLYYEEKWEKSAIFSGRIWSGKDGEVYMLLYTGSSSTDYDDMRLLKIS